ncbi:T3SS effector HopA1 family protein [Aquabacter sp. CN5-332]|uniref:T3SS effector HopA1 family protein n=1 Tax=Aquabacter sp. CN5-332 TaxID=3156608 RepID=UPI0032B4DB5A
MTRAADEYLRNIAFFASLRTVAGAKLNFDPATGLFSVASNFLSRTFSNLRATAGTEQSVTNDATFHDPVVDVFRAATQHNVDIARRREAYEGLATLRKQYAGDRTRSAALQRTLLDILQFIPSELLNQTIERFRSIRPTDVLGPLDLDFMDVVWERRGPLFAFLDEGERPDPANNSRNRPYRDLAHDIYRLYNANIEPAIVDMEAWAARLPARMKNKEGRYYNLQNRGNIPAGNAKLIANGDYNTAFIYYSPNKARRGEMLWRIYLNFEADAAGALLRRLWEISDSYAISAFKIAGPGAFHTRVDKVVIYVSQSHCGRLAGDLQKCDFGFKDPVPAMTIKVATGISKGVEPGPLDIGFSHSSDLRPGEQSRQSYGTIRAGLIAAALTQMHAVSHGNACARDRYRSDKETFLKWVAIAFEGYRRQLDGFAH